MDMHLHNVGIITGIKLTKLVTRLNYTVNQLNNLILALDSLWPAWAEAGKYTRGVGILLFFFFF